MLLVFSATADGALADVSNSLKIFLTGASIARYKRRAAKKAKTISPNAKHIYTQNIIKRSNIIDRYVLTVSK